MRFGRIKLRTALVALAVLTGLACLTVWAAPRLFPPLARREIVWAHSWPGRGQSGFTAPRATVTALATGASRLLDRDGAWSQWYRFWPREDQASAETAPEQATADQVLRLRHAVESGDRSIFKNLSAWLLNQRVDASGGCLEADGSPADNRVALDLLRALAEAHHAWGGSDTAAWIRRAATALYTTDSWVGLPADAGAVLPGPTPTPPWVASPSVSRPVTPTPHPEEEKRAYCQLAGLDVYTMRLLAAVDTRWQVAADAALAAIQNAYIGDALPLYLAGADPQDGATVPYAGDTATVDTLQALLVVMHLCEVDAARAESLAWIRRTLYNDGQLARSYFIVSGAAADLTEDPQVYAVIARVARMTHDEELYQLAIGRLTWHIADLRTSLAYGTVFRQTGDGPIEVRAADNAWALLALE